MTPSRRRRTLLGAVATLPILGLAAGDEVIGVDRASLDRLPYLPVDESAVIAEGLDQLDYEAIAQLGEVFGASEQVQTLRTVYEVDVEVDVTADSVEVRPRVDEHGFTRAGARLAELDADGNVPLDELRIELPVAAR